MSQTIQPAQNASQQLASGAAAVLPIGFGYYPREGSRAVTAQYNWAANAQYYEDASQLVARGMETAMQSCFVDNSQNSAPVILTIYGTNQVINVPAFSQGVFPAFFTGTPSYSIASPITVVPTAFNGGTPYVPVTRVYWLNVPAQAAGTWPDNVPGEGTFSALNLTAGNTQLKTGPGRLCTVAVNTAVAVGTVNFYDSLVAGIGAANLIFSLPTGAATNVNGLPYVLSIPAFIGLVCSFQGGATGTIAAAFN